MNKEEIMAKLDEAGIEYDPTSKKSELEALLPEGEAKEDGEGEEDEEKGLDETLDEVNAEKKQTEAVKVLTPAEKRKAYLQIIAAYKKQNPVKYELKKAAFEKKLASFK